VFFHHGAVKGRGDPTIPRDQRVHRLKNLPPARTGRGGTPRRRT
jgi:hypothetical protein